MDVLAYSAFNQQVALNASVSEKTSCLNTKCSETAAQQTCAASIGGSTCWLSVEQQLLRTPWCTSYYACIPELTGASQGFKVCDSGSGWYNCGVCCAWTVPAGVTRARFQIWGAGGASGQSRCCGGSPFGSTGAYASTIIPVTPGDTYTLCAGCAYFCCCFYVSSGATRPQGCQSYVAGTGLNNFCANGGQGRLYSWMTQLGKGNTNPFNRCGANNYGTCMCCCGTMYCTSGYSSCQEIPYTAGSLYFGSTTTGSPVAGIRGMWPRMCWDTNHYGYQVHPPVYGYTTTSQCTFSWTSGTCCGISSGGACTGILRVPGAGGWPSIAMGGSYNVYGDMGRGGMVCVTFC